MVGVGGEMARGAGGRDRVSRMHAGMTEGWLYQILFQRTTARTSFLGPWLVTRILPSYGVNVHDFAFFSFLGAQCPAQR